MNNANLPSFIIQADEQEAFDTIINYREKQLSKVEMDIKLSMFKLIIGSLSFIILGFLLIGGNQWFFILMYIFMTKKKKKPI